MPLSQALASPKTSGQGQSMKRTLQGRHKLPITKKSGAKGLTLPLTPPSGPDDESCETPDTRLRNSQLMSPSTSSRALAFRPKRVKLSEPPEHRFLPWPKEPQSQHPDPVTLENIDPKIFALICSYLQPVEPGADRYIFLPHVEDGRREIQRRCPTAFSSVPGTSPRLEPPDSRYKTLWFSRTIFEFKKHEDDCMRRRAWLLSGVSRNLRYRYFNEILQHHTYIVNIFDLNEFAYLATTPHLQGDEAEEEESEDKEVPPLPQLRFRNVSVFVPAGEKLPPLPLQPFYALEKEGISVDLVSQEAEKRDPAMVATIKKVKKFLANYVRRGEPLPAEYDNLHVFRGGVLYVKPSGAYLKKYRLDRVPRTIFRSRTSGLKFRDLLSDLRPLHTLTGSPVWLDMRQNMYNQQYEYLDPSKGYDEQSTIEYEYFDHIGSCVEQSFYTEGLGNHFIPKEEAFSAFNTHVIHCIQPPLRKKFSRKSYIRIFPPADDGNGAHPDENRTRLYELLNSRGVHQCGMICREWQVLGLEELVAKGQLTLDKVESAISLVRDDEDVAWNMNFEFCWTAEEKARFNEKWKSPSPKASDGEISSGEEGSQIDPSEVDEMWKESGTTSGTFSKPKPVAPRPKGYAPIKLQAWRDTIPLPEVIEVDEDDESSDESSLSGF